MERLTEKVDGGYMPKIPKDKPDMEIRWDIYDKLGKLEDAEDAGLLFILKCRPGSIVYQIMLTGVENGKPKYELFAAKVIQFVIDSVTMCFWTETMGENNQRQRHELPASAFGYNVFLDETDGKQALTKLMTQN